MRANQASRKVAKPPNPKDHQRARPPCAANGKNEIVFLKHVRMLSKKHAGGSEPTDENWLPTDPGSENLQPGRTESDKSADNRSAQKQMWTEFPCLPAHDLNNYIGVVLGRAQLLSDKCASDEKMARDCQEIIFATSRIAALIKHSRCQEQAKPHIKKTL